MAMERSYVGAIIPILVLFIAGATNFYTCYAVQATSSSSLAKDCVKELTGLYPCLDFVTNGKIKEVTPQCCSALDAIVKSNVMCLCLLFTNNSDPLGLSINQTQALLLPTLCELVVPPVSACHHLGDVPNAPLNDSQPVAKGPVNQKPALSPTDIHAAAPRSGTSKALGGAMSFIPSIIVSIFIGLSLMT